MNLLIVPGILVCSSFLISVCIFIMSKVLLISSATLIVRTGGAIWLNCFATVLFTVQCRHCRVLCFVAVLRGCVWYVCSYVRNKLFSSVFVITERRDMDLYEVPLSMSCWVLG